MLSKISEALLQLQARFEREEGQGLAEYGLLASSHRRGVRRRPDRPGPHHRRETGQDRSGILVELPRQR